jgi:hypothetical protein
LIKSAKASYERYIEAQGRAGEIVSVIEEIRATLSTSMALDPPSEA